MKIEQKFLRHIFTLILEVYPVQISSPTSSCDAFYKISFQSIMYFDMCQSILYSETYDIHVTSITEHPTVIRIF